MNEYNYMFGNFTTRTFSDVFTPNENDITEGRTQSVDMFKYYMSNSGIPLKITEENLSTLFYLLFARYGNSHLSTPNEESFLYKVASTIFMYGPSWEKRLEIQDKLRELRDEDLLKGSEAIYNSANAPGTSIAGLTDSEGKLDFLNGQNTTAYRKSKMEAYATLMSVLETDVTREFIDKFAYLFLKMAQPYSPLYFKTEVTEQ